MKLRDIVSSLSIDTRKLTDYALNPSSLKGKDKALMFEQCLGFTPDNYQPLLAQIQAQALDADAIPGIQDVHGQRYQVDLVITGAKQGQQEIVRTGWVVKVDEAMARLVTLYIRRRR